MKWTVKIMSTEVVDEYTFDTKEEAKNFYDDMTKYFSNDKLDLYAE